MKLPQVSKEDLEPGKMYICKEVDCNEYVVWVSRSGCIADAYEPLPESSINAMKFYGPVELGEG